MRNPDREYSESNKATPVLVDAQTAQRAQQQIASCESCTPDAADISLDYLLDSITGCDPGSTDYVLSEPAQCPACNAALHTGYWRWSESEEEGHDAFILPATLIALKKD